MRKCKDQYLDQYLAAFECSRSYKFARTSYYYARSSHEYKMMRCTAPSINGWNLIKDAIQFVMRAMQLANDIYIYIYVYASANSPHAGKRLMRNTNDRTDLITLICKLSGKCCNQIIRTLSDN